MRRVKVFQKVWSKFVLVCFIQFSCFQSIAAKITTAGSGNWSSTTPNAPWPNGVLPNSGDIVVIGSGFSLTVDENRTCEAIEFSVAENGVGTGSLVILLGVQLIVTGNVYAPSPTARIIDQSTYTLSGGGSLRCLNLVCGNQQTPSGSLFTTIRLNSSIAKLNIQEDISLISSQGIIRSNNAYVNISTGQIELGRSIKTSNDGIFNTSTFDLVSSSVSPTLKLMGRTPFNISSIGNSSIRLNGTDATVNYASFEAQTAYSTTYTNLTLSGSGSKNISGTIINGTISMQGAATSTGLTPSYGSASKLEYKGTVSQLTGIEFPDNWIGNGGVAIENSAGVSLTANKNINTHLLTIGSFVNGSVFSDAGYQLSATGTLNLISGSLRLGSINKATSFPLFNIRNISIGTTVEYISGVPQTVSANNYSNLYLSGGIKNATANTINVSGILTNKTIFNVAAYSLIASNIINSSGTLRFSGISNGLQTTSGTVEYYGLSQNIKAGTYENLIINQSSGTASLQGSILVIGTLQLLSGVLNTGSYSVTLSNNNPTSLVRTNGYVNGILKRAIKTGTNVYNFPVGTVSGYTPATLSINFASVGGILSVQTKNGVSTNFPTSMHSTKRLGRHWIINNSGMSNFNIRANFTYLLSDLLGGVSVNELRGFQTKSGNLFSANTSSFTGTTFQFNNITSLDNADGYSQFGAGACGTIVPSFTKTMASSCGSGVDGTITLNPLNAVSPFTYNWTGPRGFSATSAAINGLGIGDYTVVVTEATGCKTTWADITIWQALTPAVTNNGSISGSCNASGSILLYGSYGIPPYTYSIDGTNYQANNTFVNVAAGTYTGYVKDLRGCVGKKTNIVINAAPPIVVTAYVRNASSCANNGSIELYRLGGIGPYTYSLNDVTYQSSNTFNGLSSGTFTGWVKDSKGCKSSYRNIIVTRNVGVSVTATKNNTNACGKNGYVELHPAGGTPGYTFSLNSAAGPYQSSNKFNGLAAGSYRFWAMDSKGCKNFVDVTIAVGVSSSLSLTASTKPSGTCNNSGQIEIFLTGGSRSPYSYSLDDVNYQVYNNKFTGLTPGTYTAWVKDANGCKWSLPGIIVSLANPLTLNAKISPQSLCVIDGAITLLASNGVPGYAYSLDGINYQSSALFQGLAVGSYTGYVKDITGCIASLPITVAPNPIVVTAHANPALDCGSNNGNIQVFRTGGVWPYVHSIDGVNYVSEMKFLNLAPGMYTAYVKDARGCVGTLTNIEVGPVCLQSKGQTTVENQLNTDVRVMVFPNPSSSEFTLQFNRLLSGKTSVNVTDLTGRALYKLDVTSKQNLHFGRELKPGVYFVEVIRGNKKQVIKLIKE